MFLKYLLDWEENASKREGFTKAQQNQMLLSKETREGIRMTGMRGFHCSIMFILSLYPLSPGGYEEMTCSSVK